MSELFTDAADALPLTYTVKRKPRPADNLTRTPSTGCYVKKHTVTVIQTEEQLYADCLKNI